MSPARLAHTAFMQHFKHTRLFYTIILLEGYVVLAAELLAIRLLLPFVGSSVETTSIVISGVLLPLAFGYHAGGKRYQQAFAQGRITSVRALLLRNLMSAMAFYVFGLSFLFLSVFLGGLQLAGMGSPLLLVTCYTVLFICVPTYLLGQTVPLVSNYLSAQQRSVMTGRILCFSTLGSFAGSVISTIFLMNSIGVHMTAVVVVALLAAMVLLLARRMVQYETLLAALLLAAMVGMNHPATMGALHIVSANAYNTVQVIADEDKGWRDLRLNNNHSSRVANDPQDRFAYIRFMEELALTSAPRALDVLVLGAGGFTFGIEDTTRHRYQFVDIDPDLQAVSEAHFLREHLPANKQFAAQSARGYLEQHKARYDVIVVDTYTGPSIPLETVSVEFWQEVDAHLREGGMVMANLLLPIDLSDQFSQRIQDTFRQVFPRFHAQLLAEGGERNYWNSAERVNTVLVHRKHRKKGADGVYSDQLSTHSLDMLRKLY